MKTATGRELTIVSDPQGLFKIKYADGKGGSIPDKYAGRYTSENYAKVDLDLLIKETFEVAEELTRKSRKAV